MDIGHNEGGEVWNGELRRVAACVRVAGGADSGECEGSERGEGGDGSGRGDRPLLWCRGSCGSELRLGERCLGLGGSFLKPVSMFCGSILMI